MPATASEIVRRAARWRPRPAVIVAMLALTVAVGGSAAAGPLAGESALTKKEKKQATNISRGVVQSLAPGLSVNQAANADQLNGVTEGTFTIGRSGSDDTCDPQTGGTYLDCVGVDLTLPRAGRVLVIATGGNESNGGVDEGTCLIEVDDSIIPGVRASPGEFPNDHTTVGAEDNGFAIALTTGLLPAGTHTFEMSCDDVLMAVNLFEVHHSSISAVMISSS